MKYLIENTARIGIPVIELSRADTPEKLPMAIYLHGFGSYKEKKLAQGYYLAKAGYFAVLFDAPLHGDLATQEYTSLPLIERQARIFDIILETSKIINDLVFSYRGHPKADFCRTALLGSSMGGMTVFHYLANQRVKEVKAASPLIATASWNHNLRRKILEELRYVPLFPESRIREVTLQQPLDRLESLIDFPLLVQNGVDDELMPIEEIRDFRKKLEPLYTKKENLRFIEYYDVGHEATDEMIRNAIDWFNVHV